ncbi:MAG: GNAT family N-acetyltransferase, partial [Lachnospiraceae bacterium]|nr:GNAT family N-acetyltransferase [Lachnospiraceae bacterium]
GIGDDEMKRELFNSPEFMGGYITDEKGNEVMVGYVGEHLEGSIGMLYVFPEFRKRGLAYEMQAFMINRAIDKGSIPFGQIYEDNAASLALSHKMGLTFSGSMLYWLWKN